MSMCAISWAATQASTIPTRAKSRGPLAVWFALYSVQKTNKGRIKNVR